MLVWPRWTGAGLPCKPVASTLGSVRCKRGQMSNWCCGCGCGKSGGWREEGSHVGALVSGWRQLWDGYGGTKVAGLHSDRIWGSMRGGQASAAALALQPPSSRTTLHGQESIFLPQSPLAPSTGSPLSRSTCQTARSEPWGSKSMTDLAKQRGSGWGTNQDPLCTVFSRK